jgi:DNA-binding LacI/PurR family transcriptional regulator
MSDLDLDAVAEACPTVVVGRSGTSRVVGVLAADDQGLEVAVDHLVSLGHRRIAFVDGPRGSISRARRRGYRDAMARHGVGPHADVVRGGRTEADGAAAAHRLLSRALTDRPTAIVCFNDRVAIGLRDALLRAGIRVPEDVSVVGYDDSPLARLGTVDLTSVSQEPQALADATVAVLAALLDGAGAGEGRPDAGEVVEGRADERVPLEAGGDRGDPGRDVVISPRLVVRSSTGPTGSARPTQP